MITFKSLGVLSLCCFLSAACSSDSKASGTDGGKSGASNGSGGAPHGNGGTTAASHVDAGPAYTETSCPGGQNVPGVTKNFPPCDDICGPPSHCIPLGLAMGQQGFLPDCPFDGQSGPGKCVPDQIAATVGKFVFKKCAFLLGGEGRCVPQCIANQQSSAASALTPGAPCGTGEVCAPCTDPTNGDATTHACDDYCGGGSSKRDAGSDAATKP